MLGGAWLWVLSIFLIALAQAIRIGSDYFVQFWVGGGMSQLFYILVYAGFVVTFGIFLYVRGVVFFRVSLRTARLFHNDLFNKIISAPIAFFTVTPLGPLLNSFSKDQGAHSIIL